MGKRQTLEIPGVRHGAPIPMGVRMGNLVFSSGVMGRDPETDSLPPEPARQAELMFQNVRTLLQVAGGTLADVAHVTVFLKDDAYREDLNREWLKAFPDEHDRPARHTLLFDLPRGMLMQCELVAVLD
ncbi:MAG TPA: RidA family protein [Candidatus Dormibacteraeota bacterium]|nr:RidA family protein [Candidatus Dormibacteraeota bacterium]